MPYVYVSTCFWRQKKQHLNLLNDIRCRHHLLTGCTSGRIEWPVVMWLLGIRSHNHRSNRWSRNLFDGKILLRRENYDQDSRRRRRVAMNESDAVLYQAVTHQATCLANMISMWRPSPVHCITILLRKIVLTGISVVSNDDRKNVQHTGNNHLANRQLPTADLFCENRRPNPLRQKRRTRRYNNSTNSGNEK